MPGMMRSITKLVAKMDQMEAKFQKLGVSATVARVQEGTWTCVHCKTEKCYASRTICFKCGEPRVPTPPGLGAKAAAGQPAVKQEPAAADYEGVARGFEGPDFQFCCTDPSIGIRSASIGIRRARTVVHLPFGAFTR